jgi:cytochrome c biogenesis protein CcmG/thiol:disulfide interchange protein DsbE
VAIVVSSLPVSAQHALRRIKMNLRKKPILPSWLTRLALVCAWLICPVAHAAGAMDLQAFQGRVIYLDFWASWCAPCRQSFPWMQTLKANYEQRGLAVVAVNLDQDRKDAEKFLARFPPSFDVRFDPQGEVAERFKVQGMPTSIVIDRHGTVRFTHIGFRPVDETAYENEVRQVLAEK